MTIRGQYSDAVLNELESQNDGQVDGIMGKVRQLKDVRVFCPLFAEYTDIKNEDDNCNWGRNSRLFGAGGEDERLVR